MFGGHWLSMLLGRLIGASLGSKISSKTMLGVMSAVAIVLVICAIFTPETVHIKIGANTIPLSLGFLVLCGLCTSIMWGAIFNLAVEGLGKYTAAASGIFMTLVCGGGIIPFFQNLLADHVGSLQSYWLIIACLAFLVYYAFAGSKNVNTDIKVD
jgi:FHS family L-fucose permease-like MFS transporter